MIRIKKWVESTKTSQWLEIIAAFERHKWTTKVFFHSLEEAVFNSFLLYSERGGKKKFMEYKLEVVRKMLRSIDTDVTAG